MEFTLEHFAKFKMAAKMAAVTRLSPEWAYFMSLLPDFDDLRVVLYDARLTSHSFET